MGWIRVLFRRSGLYVYLGGVRVINISLKGRFRKIQLLVPIFITACIVSCSIIDMTPDSMSRSNVIPLTAQARVSESNSLVVKVIGELSNPGQVSVVYWSDSGPQLESHPVSVSGTTYSVDIVRLRADTLYQYQVFGISDTGFRTGSEINSFLTGSLPEALAKARFDVVYGQSSYPLTFLEFRQRTFYGFVAIDSDGYVVWYYEAAEGHEPYVMDQREDGNIVYLDGGFGVVAHGLAEITPLGEEMARLDDLCPPQGPMHHEVKLMDDGRIMYLSRTIEYGGAGLDATPQEGDTLGIWDPDKGTNEIVWNIFDHISPDDRTLPDSNSTLPEQFMWGGCDKDTSVQDWSHGNSIHINDDGTVLLSFRHLDQIVKLSADLEEVLWRLGGPGSQFEFTYDEDKFYHQHSASELADGNIILFDNGNNRPALEGGEYSRALELRLDHKNRTVHKVWEYRHSPDLFADCCSNVERLDNGHSLLVFGMDSADVCCRTFTIVEVDQIGDIIWRVDHTSPGKFSQYRVFPSKAIMKEREITEGISAP